MTTDPAVTAAAEALSIIGGVPDIWDLRAAGIAVAAARPIIEAEVRERIAALHPRVDREAANLPDGCGTCRQVWPCETMAVLGEPEPDYAARIARGQS